MKILEKEQTLHWLRRISSRALRKAELDRRRREFRETLERVRRLSGR
ncbi:MAG: hypothetical protein V7L23_12390 [Nostoc sp.]